MMYTMPKNLLSICVNFTLATQLKKFFALVSQMGILVRYHVQTNRYYPKNFFG